MGNLFSDQFSEPIDKISPNVGMVLARNNNSQYLKHLGSVSVKDSQFGAIGDGVKDDTIAFEKIVDFLSTRGGKLEIPEGQYRVTQSLNCTNIQVPIIWQGFGRNTLISGINNGFPVLDFTGSSFQVLNDFIISGNSVTKPNCAILFARNNTAGSAGFHRLNRIWTTGNFSKCAVYNYASEEVVGIACYLQNFEDNAKVVIQTGRNIENLTSLYQTIAAGLQSNSVIHWLGCDMNEYGIGGNEVALLLESVLDFSFTKGMFSSTGLANVAFDMSLGASVGIQLSSIRIEALTKYFFDVNGAGALTNVDIHDVVGTTEPYVGGNRTLHGAVGSLIQGLKWRNVIDLGSNAIDVDSLIYSDIDVDVNTKLDLNFAISNSKIRGKKSQFNIVRPDLYLHNNTDYNDKPQGEWTQHPFNAGDFTADVGAWTLAAGDLLNFEYIVINKTMVINLTIATSTVTAAATFLKVLIPEGLIPKTNIAVTCLAQDSGGALEVAQAQALAGAGFIFISRIVAANWGINVDGTYIKASITFNIEL